MRILLLTFHYPPERNGAIPRRVIIENHLRNLGHDLAVVSPLPRDRALCGGPHITVPWPSKTMNPGDGHGSGWWPKLKKSPLGSSLVFLKNNLLFPDPQIFWAVRALSRVKRRLNGWSPQMVLANNPPESVLILGMLLARRFKASYVADICDGWSFEPLRPEVNGRLRHILETRAEAFVFGKARSVLFATRPLQEAAALQYPRWAERFLWLPTGFADFFSGPTKPDRERPYLDLVYAGRFFSSDFRRTPELFFEGLERLGARRPEVFHSLRVTLLGEYTDQDRQAWATKKIGCLVFEEPMRPYEAMRARLAAASILLLVTPPAVRSISTQKLFDYLSVRRPIFALAKDNEAASIIGETDSGICAPPDDPAVIAEYLERVWDWWRTGQLERRITCGGNDQYLAAPHLKRVFSQVLG